jgi:SAM-dependent methyltransferase
VPAPCRACGAPLRVSVVDLGLQPLANSYLSAAELERTEPRYPLHPYVCDRCWLMQLENVATPDEIFSDYAYFSSYSDSWLEHARSFVEQIMDRLALGCQHLVVEVASNDGYLLRNFVEREIPVLGIEPAPNVAKYAIASGVPTEVVFFGQQSAERLRSRGVRADLLIGNNVLAHVPDLHDFVSGLATLLAPQGTLTMEFPYVLRLLEEAQFDTIYHEHYSYFSLAVVRDVFARHGLTLFEVEELPTHGGSLRIYAAHADENPPMDGSVTDLLHRERSAELAEVGTYRRLDASAQSVKRGLLGFLEDARRLGHSVVAYGAPAKGNTLLNYCGVTTELVSFTVDRSPHKQGLYLPGSHLPIRSPEELLEARPDYVLVLPWNLKEEIVQQMAEVQMWGGRFAVPIPELTVL